MVDKFDLVVLGSGPAGSTVASKCADAHWKTAVVDSRPVGGNCALRGCNPKKVLVRAAELIDRACMMRGNGTELDATQIQWGELIRFKRTFTEPVVDAKQSSFEEQGIEVIRGEPRWIDERAIQVGGRVLQLDHCLIAVGAAPVSLPFQGADLLITSDDFLELDSLPRRLVFVGGGYIAFEFAHVAARAGAEVSIIDRAQPLARFEPDLVERLIDRSRTIGIDVRTNSEVTSVERSNGGFRVMVSSDDKEPYPILCDLVVHSAGRAPQLDQLDLQQASVQYGRDGIAVNEYLQSVSNPAVYAAGDAAATSSPPLSPVAGYQGTVVANNLLNGNSVKSEEQVVPSAVFSSPSLAKVGWTEAEAIKNGIDYRLEQGDWSEFNSMKKVGETHAMYKVLVDQSSNQIVGAHLLGPEAAETINLFALAMTANIPARDLKSTLFTFPTFAADIRSML
jgi:glutathione reductase (NADPH)